MINLNNYEEYFLLYIDNELGNEQREAVEAFVQQHPHLAAELNMLQDTKLPAADEVLFSNKDALYKTADSSININNYEEYFLLHTDKELAANQEEEVEQFVLQHPQLQEEFLLIKSTKLTPEIIEYPDKQRLYKQDRKRIIPIYFTRMAVAAAVTGLIMLAGNILLNKNNQQPETAKNTQQSQPTVEKKILEKDVAPAALPEKQSNDVVVAKVKIKSADKAPAKAAKNIEKLPASNNALNMNDNKPVIAKIDARPNTQLTTPPVEALVSNATVAVKQKQPTVLKPLEEVSEKEAVPEVMYVSNEEMTKPAIYKEINTEEDDQTLYVGSLQLNKAKVNGLFKKAAHLLGGKAKDSSL